MLVPFTASIAYYSPGLFRLLSRIRIIICCFRMADSDLSSELEQETCPPPAQPKKQAWSKRHKARSDGVKNKVSRSSCTKDEMRRHKALEKRCEQAKRTKRPSICCESSGESGPSSSSQQLSADSGSLRSSELDPRAQQESAPPQVPLAPQTDQPLRARSVPEATFTPTAAGLRPEESSGQLDFQSLLSDALAKILVAGLQQGAGSAQPQTSQQPHARSTAAARQSAQDPAEDVSSDESDQAEDCPEDIEFFEDEGLPPEKPVFTGLFRPSVFKSLLHKAKVTTQFGMTLIQLTQPISLQHHTMHCFRCPSWRRTLFLVRHYSRMSFRTPLVNPDL